MRTDSTRVSDAALGEVRGFIGGTYGEQYLPEKANFYKGKKDAQDAHEAIRPTDVNRTPDSLASNTRPGRAEALPPDLAAFCRVADDAGASLIRRRSISKRDDLRFARPVRCRNLTASSRFIRKAATRSRPRTKRRRRTNLPLVEQGRNLKLNAITPNSISPNRRRDISEATLVKAWKKKASAARRHTRRS